MQNEHRPRAAGSAVGAVGIDGAKPLSPGWLDLARVLQQIAANHADELRARREQAKGKAFLTVAARLRASPQHRCTRRVCLFCRVDKPASMFAVVPTSAKEPLRVRL